MGPSEIKLLTACIVLTQSLATFLTCGYSWKLQFGRGYITATVTSDHSWQAEPTPTPSRACLTEVNSLCLRLLKSCHSQRWTTPLTLLPSRLSCCTRLSARWLVMQPSSERGWSFLGCSPDKVTRVKAVGDYVKLFWNILKIQEFCPDRFVKMTFFRFGCIKGIFYEDVLHLFYRTPPDERSGWE